MTASDDSMEILRATHKVSCADCETLICYLEAQVEGEQIANIHLHMKLSKATKQVEELNKEIHFVRSKNQEWKDRLKTYENGLHPDKDFISMKVHTEQLSQATKLIERLVEMSKNIGRWDPALMTKAKDFLKDKK